MNDLTGMFDEGTDLDARLEEASYILKQAAEEEGVDLDQFSEEDLSGMLANIAGGDEGEGEGEPANDNGKTAGDITVADVSLELHKRASNEGLDLTQVHPEVYEELFDKVAAEMTDPSYYEESQKWAHQAASMDELGRVAARGFVDEINKLAADDDDDHRRRRRDDDDDDEVDIKVKKAAYLLKQAASPIRPRVGVREGLSDAAHSAGKYIKGKVNRGFERVGNKAIDRAAGEKGFHQSSSKARRESLGRKVVGAGAGGVGVAGGAGYGGKKLHDHSRDGGRKKKAGLEDVAEALDTLRAAGFDV